MLLPIYISTLPFALAFSSSVHLVRHFAIAASASADATSSGSLVFFDAVLAVDQGLEARGLQLPFVSYLALRLLISFLRSEVILRRVVVRVEEFHVLLPDEVAEDDEEHQQDDPLQVYSY